MAIPPPPNTNVRFLDDQGNLTLPWLRWFRDVVSSQNTGTVGPPGPAGPAGPAGASGSTTGLEFTSLAGNDWELIAGAGVSLTPSPSYGGPTIISAPGAVGIPGWDGEDGLPGPPGVPGSAGPTGPAGPAGASGQSLIGPPGAQGEPGEDGWPIPGPQGATGPTGNTGSQGPPGVGTLGIPGWDGEDSEGWAMPGPIGPAGPAGGGAITLISEVITAGSQASITFSSISGSYRDLILRVRGRGDTSATTTTVAVQFNGDTGNNYNIINIYFAATGTTVSGAVAAPSGSDQIGLIPAATATASYMGTIEALIAGYSQTTFFKVIHSRYDAFYGTFNISQIFGIFGGTWANTAAITSVKVSLTAGNFVNGSIVSLYGSS